MRREVRVLVVFFAQQSRAVGQVCQPLERVRVAGAGSDSSGYQQGGGQQAHGRGLGHLSEAWQESRQCQLLSTGPPRDVRRPAEELQIQGGARRRLRPDLLQAIHRPCREPAPRVDHCTGRVERPTVHLEGGSLRRRDHVLGIGDAPTAQQGERDVDPHQHHLGVVEVVCTRDVQRRATGGDDVNGRRAAGQQHVGRVDATPHVAERVLERARLGACTGQQCLTTVKLACDPHVPCHPHQGVTEEDRIAELASGADLLVRHVAGLGRPAHREEQVLLPVECADLAFSHRQRLVDRKSFLQQCEPALEAFGLAAEDRAPEEQVGSVSGIDVGACERGLRCLTQRSRVVEAEGRAQGVHRTQVDVGPTDGRVTALDDTGGPDLENSQPVVRLLPPVESRCGAPRCCDPPVQLATLVACAAPVLSDLGGLGVGLRGEGLRERAVGRGTLARDKAALHGLGQQRMLQLSLPFVVGADQPSLPELVEDPCELVLVETAHRSQRGRQERSLRHAEASDD